MADYGSIVTFTHRHSDFDDPRTTVTFLKECCVLIDLSGSTYFHSFLPLCEQLWLLFKQISCRIQTAVESSGGFTGVTLHRYA